MPEDGTFMQQRLFLSLGTIASYWLETLTSDRKGQVTQNSREGGREVFPEKGKTGSIDL